MKVKKYLPYIIGYCIYASIVLINIAHENYHYSQLFILWLITIPLIIGVIAYIVWRHHKNNTDDGEEVITEGTVKESLFVENWNLLDFAREYGPRMQVGGFTNAETGASFTQCIFTQEDGTQTYVMFFSQLGVLSPLEISKRKEELKVGRTKEGKFFLHDEYIKLWEDVEL